MRRKMQFVAISLVCAVISLATVQPTLAQHAHDHGATEWKKGIVRLNETAWIGAVRLKSGMYHVKHVTEGNKHMLVFRSVALPAGKEFPMWEGKEVARLECRVEPARESLRNTKVIVSKNAAIEQSIAEIQIAGEKVRHILIADSLAA